MFTWILQVLATADLVKGKTIGIDATTLEANAALRSIVRRDSGETYQEFLTRLAQASGIETPTRADLARLDRKRPKKGRNTDWRHPHDPDARITKMKDGRTHLAHKAEHAVDLETGAIVGVTVQGADQGDTTTIAETVTAAAEELEAVAAATDGHTAVIDEVVADKGYHSNQVLVDLAALDLRTYIAEPDRGRRNWKKKAAARDAVYANRRRIRGARGRALLRRRSERLERPNAHLYETGGMRRTHLRGHANILKRLLVHIGGFNLGLLMRTLIGVGTPRGLQGRLAALMAVVIALWTPVVDLWRDRWTPSADHSSGFTPHHRFERLPVGVSEGLFNHGLLAAGFDFVSAYAASKFGLEGWMESLQAEVAPFGIVTTIVNPGFFRTELLTEQSTNFAEPSVADYNERRGPLVEYWKAQNGQQSGDPREARARSSRLRARNDRRAASSPAPMPSPPPNRRSSNLKAQIEAHRQLSTSLAFD